MLKNMKLGIRLGMGFGAVLAFLVIILVIVIISMNRIQADMRDITEVNEHKMNLCEAMSDNIYKEMLNTREILLSGDKAHREELRNEIAGFREGYDTASEALDRVQEDEAGIGLLKEIKGGLAQARPLTDKVLELAMAGDGAGAVKALADEATPAVDKWIASLDEALELQYGTNATEAADAKKNYDRTLVIIIVLGSLSVLLGTLIALLVTRGITKPVNRIVESLSEGAQQVASASDQLSATSQQLAEGNSEQASSIEETSSTLEESASMVLQNSENTKQAAQLAAQTKISSDKGNNDMLEMMNSMNEIKKSSDQIAKIMKVIDEIAFQTNILALNAAVEAARAGDAGMGFAVVAEEVRNLAQRSAQAAKDTEAIIESNIELSEKGVNVARKVGESLSEINVQAKKVNELMDEIAAASQEQSQGISQINRAISQMEKVTQQNAANAQESASASEELSSQAQNLRDITLQLVRLVNGSSPAEADGSGNGGSSRGVRYGGNGGFKHGAGDRWSAGNGKTAAGNKNQFKAGLKLPDPEDIIPLSDNTGGF